MNRNGCKRRALDGLQVGGIASLGVVRAIASECEVDVVVGVVPGRVD
jgi:hypothetical protein